MTPLSHECRCDRRLEIRWEKLGLGEWMKRILKDGGQRKRHDGQNGRNSESHPSLLEDGRVVTDEGEANGQ